MANYSITNTLSGADLGTYEADSPEATLDSMAREAGYADHAAACEVAPVREGELRVELVQSIEVDLDTPMGPIVVVTGEHDESEIEGELPDGWTVGDNWGNGVQRPDGSWAYPIVRADAVTRVEYTYAYDSLADIPSFTFEEALTDALEEAYPDAEVSIVRGGVSGVSWEGGPDGESVREDVKIIAERVFDECCRSAS